MEEHASKEFTPNEFQSEQTQFPRFGNAGYAPQVDSSIQDHIEAGKSNGWGNEAGKFLQTRGKRIGIVLAIVLLFAAISFMSNKKEDAGTSSQSTLPQTADISNSITIPEDSTEKEKTNTDANVHDVLKLKLGETGQVLAENTANSKMGPVQNNEPKDSSSITKEAQKGEGITHLARYAIKDYIKEVGKSLSPEQKIYAEDYVQNRIGNERLHIGQKLSFSRDLLKEAVAKSELLKPVQLENLKQYSAHARL